MVEVRVRFPVGPPNLISFIVEEKMRRGSITPVIIFTIFIALLAGGLIFSLARKKAGDKAEAERRVNQDKQQTSEEATTDVFLKKTREDDLGLTKKVVATAATETAKKETEPVTEFKGAVLAGNLSKLFDFNEDDYNAALRTNKLIVLYFYANWCPICKEEVPHLYEAFNELSADRVIGFRVNFNDSDTDTEEKNLAREFGVAYQQTKVFIKNGQRILKSPETWEKDRYLSEINKFIQ